MSVRRILTVDGDPERVGAFIQRVAVSSTMGPGVKVDPATLGAGSA